MNLNLSIIIAFIGSFIIQYYIMSFIMVYRLNDFQTSIAKIYLSLLLSILISILQIVMYDISILAISLNYYIVFITAFIVILVLYKKQIGIREKDYLKEMIEYSSMTLLASSEFLRKAKDQDIKKYAKRIIKNQTKEIDEMKEIIAELH
jgi:hypothetical protein